MRGESSPVVGCSRWIFVRWRRAAYSVALNLAEGASRRGPREFRRYVEFARASLDEIEAILDLVATLGYFRREELAKVEAVRDECAKTVYGLMRKLGQVEKRP